MGVLSAVTAKVQFTVFRNLITTSGHGNDMCLKERHRVLGAVELEDKDEEVKDFVIAISSVAVRWQLRTGGVMRDKHMIRFRIMNTAQRNAITTFDVFLQTKWNSHVDPASKVALLLQNNLPPDVVIYALVLFCLS